MTQPSENLTRDTLMGLGWVYGGTVVGAVMQLAYTAVMARLLAPRDFGLLAMALVVERFGDYFARMGVSQALVQKPILDSKDVRVALTTSVVLGVVFGGAVMAAAPVAGSFLDSSAVIPVVRVLTLAFVLGSFAHVSTSLLRRSLRFRALSAIEVTSHAVGFLGVGIGMALMGFGVWSLVGARLAHSLAQAVLCYAVTRHSVLPLFDWSRFRALYGYGSRVSVISFFEFLGTSLDTLLIGRYAGSAILGYYNRAFLLVNIPFHQVVTGFSKVLFPTFSRIQSETERLRGAYRSTYMILSGILLPIAAGLAVAAPEVVRTIIGPQWGLSADVLPILAVAGAVSFLSHIGGVVCDATATLNRKLALQVMHVALLVALLILATRQDSVVAYAAAVLAAELFRHLMYMALMNGVLGVGVGAHLRLLLPSLTGAAVVAVAIALASAALRPLLPSPAVFASQLTVGAAVVGACLWWGPMVAIRRDIARRLGAAEMLTGGKRVSRAVAYLLAKGR